MNGWPDFDEKGLCKLCDNDLCHLCEQPKPEYKWFGICRECDVKEQTA
jgi:hypothetical protein